MKILIAIAFVLSNKIYSHQQSTQLFVLILKTVKKKNLFQESEPTFPVKAPRQSLKNRDPQKMMIWNQCWLEWKP